MLLQRRRTGVDQLVCSRRQPCISTESFLGGNPSPEYIETCTKTFPTDSMAIMKVALADSTLNIDYLNSYRKKAIPISVKKMSSLKPYKEGFYHNNYSEGNYTLKDTLYIFGEIKSYKSTSSRVNLNIPSEGVWAHYYLIKIKEKWTIVKDSTDMYET